MSKGQKTEKEFSYLQSPDGEDIPKKIETVLRPTLLFATGISTFDVMCYSHPKGYLNTLGRFAYVGAPIVATSAVFVLGSNMAGSIRKKDDMLNWFIGGFAAGSVWGVRYKRPMIGFNMGVLFGTFGLVWKYCNKKGWLIHPNEYKPAFGSVWSANQDWSLTKERPRNWTTGN